MNEREVHLTVNGEPRRASVEPRRMLSELLRDDLELTGTHVACEHGVCGACTVLLDGQPVRSCLVLGVQADGRAVTTIEGVAGDELHPVQQGFYECHSFQCGFCTPGFVMSTLALLADDPAPEERAIREGVSGNLCRCTGYESIVRGVQRAAELLAEGGS